MAMVLDKIKDITTLIFDVDGVFTDSTLLITESGELLRKMNVRDGYAIKKAVNAGFRVAIITGGGSEGVTKRLNGLGITDVFTRAQNKIEIYEAYLRDHQIPSSAVLYMGDDEMDIECLKASGVACCPKDADPSTHAHVDYICEKLGGHGCVREVVQMVMEVQEKWKAHNI